jgi:hypothetical protein
VKKTSIIATRIALKSVDCAKGSKRTMITIVAALSAIYAMRSAMNRVRRWSHTNIIYRLTSSYWKRCVK